MIKKTLLALVLLPFAFATAEVCDGYKSQAYQIVGTGQPSWVYDEIRYFCSPQSIEALRLVWDNQVYDWEVRNAARVNTDYALQAFRLVRDNEYYDWELQWAANVNTSYALEAFTLIRDGQYYDWEAKWASHVNSAYALEAFKSVRDNQYYEFELRWAADVNSNLEIMMWRDVIRTGSWTEAQLRQAATMTDFLY